MLVFLRTHVGEERVGAATMPLFRMPRRHDRTSVSTGHRFASGSQVLIVHGISLLMNTIHKDYEVRIPFSQVRT
jgi:hypothetical protein